MCCNRSNNNNNVQGNSGRCGCGCRCGCRCRCGCDNNENVGGATEIALRGPGCINGTGRCLRRNENVQGDSGCGRWNNENRGCGCGRWDNENRGCGCGRWDNRNCCEWCFRCLRELNNNMNSDSMCPR